MYIEKTDSMGIRPNPKAWYHRRFGTPIEPNRSVQFTHIAALFNGKNFILKGDNKIIFEKPANSGRNEKVGLEIAQLCKGQETDVYMNNKKYSGIKDYGTIPEGQYSFILSQGSTFTTSESLELFSCKWGGCRDALGMVISGGDWGRGRLPLHPFYFDNEHITCGDPEQRDKFYLHSGYSPGSAGCVELSNEDFLEMLKLLNGYPQPIVLRVAY